MHMTEKRNTDTEMTKSTEGLSASLGCGRSTAVKIGELAGAKIKIGRRVLWNMSKVQKYLDSVSTE